MPDIQDDGEQDFTGRARRLAEHDADSVDTSPEELRMQWNVAEGRMPHIPLWLSLAFFVPAPVQYLLDAPGFVTRLSSGTRRAGGSRARR